MEVRDFKGGLDQDTSPINYTVGKYFDCLNMRIISDESLTTSALQNIKGNTRFTFIPDTGAVARGELIEDYDPDNFPGTIDITIASTTSTYTPVYAATLAEFLQGIVDFINSGGYPGFKAYLDGKKTAIYIIDLAGGTVIPFISFISTGFLLIDYTFVFNLSFIQPQFQLKIIGWVVLREDIYILTTNVTTANPGGVDPNLPPDGDGVGQIWKIVYDKVTKIATTPELIYNNKVNFTLQHPIPNPGGIEARYENIQIQRIYWTDNFNKLRTLNVADPNAYALDPNQLDIGTKVLNTFPISQYLLSSGGALATGAHQIAYRLKNTGGSTTAFSIPSNIVSITNKAEYLNYGADLYTQDHFEGADPGTPTSKAIQYEIKYLDTNYDRVEIVSLYRENKNDTPIINIIYDDPMPSDGIYRFVYTGNEIGIPISLNEFTGRSVDFKTVKTIAQKNNRLFPANIKRANFDFDFDARAYRFPLTGANTPDDTTDIYDKVGNPYGPQVTPGTWANIPINHDAIQDYDSQAPDDWTNFLYQPSSVSASPVLGGAGPNVSYSFTPFAVPNDFTHLLDDSDLFSGSSERSPYRTSNKYSQVFTMGIQDQYFPINSGYFDNHNGLISGLLRGYMRDEMYRFGLVLYDLQGNPGFVNWIADIRMPHIWMPDHTNATSTTRTMQNPISTYDAVNNICTGIPLGILFNVDLGSIDSRQLDKISGFSIVRCKRNITDKRVLGQGSIFPIISDTGVFYTVKSGLSPTNWSYTAVWEDGVCMNSPDFLFEDPPTYNTSDELDVISILEENDVSTIRDWAGGDNNGMIVVKNYENLTTLNSITNPLSQNPYDIVQSMPLEVWVDAPNTVVDINGNKIRNETPIFGGVTQGGGSKTLYLNSGEWKLDFGNAPNKEFANAVNDNYESSHRLYLANYKTNPILPYTGNSFTNRSNNEYIPCGNFIPIVDRLITNFSPFVVFGGDTFVTLFDNVRHFGNIACDWETEATYRGNIFAVETGINTELRQAKELSGYDNNDSSTTKFRYVFNKQSLPEVSAIGIGVKEEFSYNFVYSAETDYIKYFPKPEPFLNNEEFDNRIYSSEVKVNGELADSWGIFKEANYLDVDGIVGPINNLITLTNSLLFFQDKGVGKAAIEERAAVATSSGDLTIGTSGVLSRYDYLTRETGSKHQFGFTKNDNTVWFYDSISKKIYELSGEGNTPISDIKGMHTYLINNLTGDIINTDNPYYSYGVTATYDYKNNEAVFTFKDTNTAFTLAYNIFTKSFTSFYSFTPQFYINDKYNIITSENGTNLWLHDNNPLYGNFYNTSYESRLSILSNYAPIETKILSNVEYLTEAFDVNNVDQVNDTWNYARFRNSKQNTDYQPIDSLISRRRERTWNLQVPRDRVLPTVPTNPNPNIFTELSPTRIKHGKKMRDKYFITDLKYNNLNRLVMHYIKLLYSSSPR